MRSVGGLASARLVAVYPQRPVRGRTLPAPSSILVLPFVLPKSYDVDELLAVVRNFCG